LADDICVPAYFGAITRIVKRMCGKRTLHARNVARELAPHPLKYDGREYEDARSGAW
jgi:hypothetical protein